jgi:DNA polymerase-1
MESLRDKVLIFHNAKFDLKFISYATKNIHQHIYDTMLAEIILNAGRGTKYYSLGDLVEKYTDYFMDKTERKEFIGFPDEKPFTESMLQYSALDVLPLQEIYEEQLRQFKETYQEKILEIEMELVPIVTKMEMDGIVLDAGSWLEVEKKAVEVRDDLSRQLLEMVSEFAMTLKVPHGLALAETLKIPINGKARRKSLEDITDITFLKEWVREHFNPKSTHQMKAILHLMGMKVKNTNEKTLEDLKGKKPIIDLLLSIREVNKQIDSYGRNVIELIHPITGKLHTEYSTVGTQTGRFSSGKPNMQNMPVHGGYRECFRPDPGFVFVSIDYSQQEYRLAGAISGDKRIINAYKMGSDMHTATAQVLFKKDKVTKDERSRGKTVNFAILYGSTEFGLKKNLNISENEAKQIIDEFWKGYKYLSSFMEYAGEKIMELGFSSTPLGRRRYSVVRPVFMNSYELDRWKARVLREGRNHIIQGGGADILKLAMLRISKENPYGDKLRLCLQIHDELVFQIHESIKEEGALFAKKIMEEEEQKFLGEIPAQVDGWKEFTDRWSK